MRAQNTVQTQGVLFNRQQPRGLDGESVKLIGRDGKQTDGKNYLFNQGKDIGSLDDRSAWKYRIPPDSCVNKKGDACVCGLTAAQWIWCLNLVCFLAHTTGVILTAYFAWWSKDLEALYGKDVNPYLLPVYRISATWNNDTTAGYDFVFEDNGIGFDVAWGTISFFGLSAIFHLFAVVIGLCECSWFVYWRCALDEPTPSLNRLGSRQLDDAFAYWRWLEYSGSCSIMGVMLALSVGIREQYLLTCIFMLYFTTMWLGFLTELYSRPAIIADTKDYQWAVGRLGFTGKPDYKSNPNALHLLSQDVWEGDRPIRDPATGEAIASTAKFTQAQRCSNYFRRLVPHALGYFPFCTALAVTIHHLEYSRWQLEQNTDLKMPNFVSMILYGSYLLFSSFTFVQLIFQWLPPSYYWGSEICYCILSLSAKAWLGTLMIVFTIATEMRASDVLGAGGLQSA